MAAFSRLDWTRVVHLWGQGLKSSDAPAKFAGEVSHVPGNRHPSDYRTAWLFVATLDRMFAERLRWLAPDVRD